MFLPPVEPDQSLFKTYMVSTRPQLLQVPTQTLPKNVSQKKQIVFR